MIHDTILDHAEQHRGEPFEINLSAGEHIRGDVVLDANLPFSRLKITAANGASLSGMIEVRAGAPPVEFHGLDIDGQVLIEAGFDRTVEIAGCRFRASASQGRRLQPSTYSYSYIQATFGRTFVRALLVSGGSVTVSNTVFEGLQGGAIKVSGGDLTVHTSAFEKNEAERGGALLVTGGEVRLYNSTFTANEAEEGGALFITSGEVRLHNSTFADNKANEGGAIRVIGLNATLELADLTQIVGSEGSGGSVASDVKWTYVLPGPLGHYVSKEQEGVARNGAGDYVLGDYPIPCLGGLFGNSYNVSDQSKASCTGECPAGYHCPEGNIEPVTCSAGTYCVPRSAVETDCPAGTYNPNSTGTSEEDCSICGVGHFCTAGSKTETACPKGEFGNETGLSMCFRCEAGSSQGKMGQAACDACPRGGYCDVVGAVQARPTPCPAGTWSDRTGLKSAEECDPCPVGSWCSGGSVISCPKDTFNNRTSQVNQGACTACPEDAVAPEASSSVSACKCVEDYYDVIDHPGDVECRRCPFGSACDVSGYTLARLPLLPGFWRTNDNSSDLRRCPDASSPDTSACANNKDGSLCKPWTVGPYCRICNVTDGSRYFDSDQSACVECGDTATTSLATLVGTTLAVLLLLCWCGWRQPCRRLRNVAYQALLKIRAPLKQMVAFYQITTRIESVFKVSMPASVASLLNIFHSLNLSIELLRLPLSCLQLSSFFDQLLFLVLAPCALGLLVLTCSMAAEVLTKRKAASLKAGLIRALPYLLYLLFFAFPLVSSRAFQVFDCEEFDDGTRFLRVDYSLDCDDNEYDRVVYLAWVAIALYPVGIPLLYLTLLLTARKAILTEHPTDLSRSLTFLTSDYEPSMYWWEMVEISKKLFLVGFCVLIRPGSMVQLIIGFVFSLVILLFTSIAEPFQQRAHDKFSLVCNFSLVMFLFLSLILKMGVLSEDVEESGLLSDELQAVYTFDPASLSVALILTLLASVIVASVLAVYQVYQTTRAAARVAAAEREASIARGRLSHPPCHEWDLRQGNCFCMFLSHFKEEAGSDARYLSDLIKRMTGCAAYLDSNDLVDLRTLFNEGVHKSDVLVILATRGVLTRPWCLMEMWEAAVNEIPIVLFPVVGGNWTVHDARTLLSDLMGQMQGRNQWCMPEVMAHVGAQGVTDVREVEDVLLAHIGLVSSLERPRRPASMELDRRLCAHLKKDVADLASWLPAYNAVVEQRLSVISWQSWGSDNQIIASVQTLVDECALALGRAQPEWTDTTWELGSQQGEENKGLGKGLLGCLCRQRQAPSDARGRLLIICAQHECSGSARLLQRQLEDELQCEVVIGSNNIDTWRGEVEAAMRGVVLLQTQTVLHNPMRLLQLFEAVQQRRPLVCVNVVGGGYDFAKVKPLLLSLSNELSQGEMAMLRTELMAHGNGVRQLGSCLSDSIPLIISVFLDPAASDTVIEAAIQDIRDKLERTAELLQSQAIAVSLLLQVSPSISTSGLRRLSASTPPLQQQPP